MRKQVKPSWLLTCGQWARTGAVTVVGLAYKGTWRTSPSSSTWYLVVSFTTLPSLCFASFSRSYNEWKRKQLSVHLGSQCRINPLWGWDRFLSLLHIWLLFSSNTFSEIRVNGNYAKYRATRKQEAPLWPPGKSYLAEWSRLSVRSETYTTNTERFMIQTWKASY